MNIHRQATDRSYRALLATPFAARLLLGMQIARIGQSMVSVTIVLFTLSTYQSPALAGIASFSAVFPGLVVAPIAGALLDRHGRSRLVILDYSVALIALTLMGVLALNGLLTAWLLIVIAAISSLTAPLSNTGLRSLFPLIVPSHLWERINALDSTGFLVATIFGPPLAATLVAFWGGPVAFIVIGLSFGVAALVTVGAPDPHTAKASRAPLLAEAWHGLVYTWRNPSLRGLGVSVSTMNLAGGVFTIVAPLIVLQKLNLNESVVGLVLAVQGITGMLSAVYFGRLDSRNRERLMLAAPMFGCGIVIALLLLEPSLILLGIVMGLSGFFYGPLDIALFTLRQRRTHREWTGRAFAVSMALNYVGHPVGSALIGFMVARSIELAIIFGVVSSLVSGVLALIMIPAAE